jgi:hypothetical protein
MLFNIRRCRVALQLSSPHLTDTVTLRILIRECTYGRKHEALPQLCTLHYGYPSQFANRRSRRQVLSRSYHDKLGNPQHLLKIAFAKANYPELDISSSAR